MEVTSSQCLSRTLAIVTAHLKMVQKNKVGRPGTGILASSPSPLEVLQLLLEQEYVGFELIPLLKDLLKLFPAESTLDSSWRVPWFLSIHLCKVRNGQRAVSLSSP